MVERAACAKACSIGGSPIGHGLAVIRTFGERYEIPSPNGGGKQIAGSIGRRIYLPSDPVDIGLQTKRVHPCTAKIDEGRKGITINVNPHPGTAGAVAVIEARNLTVILSVRVESNCHKSS